MVRFKTIACQYYSMNNTIQKLDLDRVTNELNKNWGTYDYYATEENFHDLLHYFPARQDCYQLGISFSGNIKLRVDGREMLYTKNIMATFTPSTVMEVLEVSDDYRGRFIVFKKEFLLESISNIYFLDRFRLLAHTGVPYIQLDEEEAELLTAYFVRIRTRMEDKDHPFRKEIIRSLILILLNESEYVYLKKNPESRAAVASTGKNKILSDFQDTLRQNFYTERKVSFYAGVLKIPAEQLSDVLKELTGQTAKDAIEEMVLSEAKVLLRTGKYNVSEVASLLNYNNLEEFSRFFKRKSGYSPLRFAKTGA